MAADDSTAKEAEENRHYHPLMYLHANNSNSDSRSANNAAVKREMKPTCHIQDNATIMNPNKSSSKTSSVISIKSISAAILLLLVVISLHSMLQTFEVIDNKIATSAILLHHCHSFVIAFTKGVFNLLYAIRDIIFFLAASSSSIMSSSSSSSSDAGIMVMEQFQSRLRKGQQLLSQYKDISGSEMVCKSVANAVVLTANERKRDKHRGGDDSKLSQRD